jgi:hypothetical protein
MSEYVSLPGYEYPIGVPPSGTFDLKDVDLSTGEPIVRRPGGYWVWGRGCTQPGGGIMPHWGFVKTDANGRDAPRVVIENDRIIRIDGNPVVGFGVGETVSAPTVRAPSPWAVAITTSVVGAAVGWAIEEVARNIRGRRRP